MTRQSRNPVTARTLTAALAWSAATAPAVASVSHVDGAFNNSDWSVTMFANASATGSSALSVQELTGGASGSDEFRRIKNSLQVGGAGAFVIAVHLNSTFIYDPGTQGAITHFTFREQSRNILAAGNGQASGLVIKQGGNIYIQRSGLLTMPSPLFSNWQINFCASISSSQMHRIDGQGNILSGDNPDFSASGGAMTLGFLRENAGGSAGDGLLEFECGIDDICITAIPGPGAMALLAVGGALAPRRRRG